VFKEVARLEFDGIIIVLIDFRASLKSTEDIQVRLIHA
jgi:hypothetical protein